MIDDDQIELAYTPTYHDFLGVLFWWHVKKLLPIFVIIEILALSALSITIFNGKTSGFWFGLPLVPIVFFVLTGIFTVFLPARKAVASVHPDLRYLFTDEYIRITSSTIDSRFPWSEYNSVSETQNAFVLSPFPGALVPMPKRLFRDESQIERFREMVRNGIGMKARLRK